MLNVKFCYSILPDDRSVLTSKTTVVRMDCLKLETFFIVILDLINIHNIVFIFWDAF